MKKGINQKVLDYVVKAYNNEKIFLRAKRSGHMVYVSMGTNDLGNWRVSCRHLGKQVIYGYGLDELWFDHKYMRKYHSDWNNVRNKANYHVRHLPASSPEPTPDTSTMQESPRSVSWAQYIPLLAVSQDLDVVTTMLAELNEKLKRILG